MRHATTVVPILLLAVAAGLAACTDSGTNGPTTQPLNIGGAWSFTETLSDPGNQLTCIDNGTLTASQSGSGFTGTVVQVGTCTTPGGPVDNSGTLTIAGGSISGSNVSFIEPGAPDCVYHGRLAGTPPSSATGTVACTGGGFDFAGTWSMSR